MTHSERVLSLLSDGQPHAHMELYRLGVMAHSRVADLRRKGHSIRCWKEGDSYWYQLVTVRAGEVAVVGGDPGTPSRGRSPLAGAVPLKGPQCPEGSVSPPRPGAPSLPCEARPAPHRQLTVFEAA